MNGLVSTFLVGMLVASVALNVHQWQGESFGNLAESEQGLEQEAMAMPISLDVQKLDLSEEQQQALSQCGDGCCCAAMALREQVRVATIVLQEACAAAEIDEQHLQELAKTLCDLREQEVMEHIDAMLSVREVLEPEQLEELYEIACEEGCMK